MKTVNIIYILDSSSSMRGGKYDEGRDGFVQDIQDLIKSTEIKYTFTLIEFSQHVQVRYFKETDYEKVLDITSGLTTMGGMTALNDAIGHTIVELLKHNVHGDGNIVSIITDGAENCSKKYKFNDIKTMISVLEDLSYTVTFVGTNFDTQAAIGNYGISKNNTLAHDNTADGFRHLSNARRASISSYSNKFAAGAGLESLTSGFYNDNDTTNHSVK